MKPTAPGIHSIASMQVSINKNGTVVIFCPFHKEWVTAAGASSHFATWRGKPSAEHAKE